ncbi:MAG: tyrosine-type recombinase/integrase [Clostridiales Family XIII bacterium]|jgi:integrase|nr:tyrosine-type recombinase/integrase [Clostridiales Family XIII bacterium]
MATTQPIRNKQQLRAMAEYYLKLGQFRNYVLIVIGIHTALRVSDILCLRWGDVYDFATDRAHVRATVIEHKTGKQKSLALHKKIVAALSLYASHHPPEKPEDFVFVSRRKSRAIGRVQAYRIVRAAAEALKIGRISCHSLRKTFGYHAWKSGISPAVIMEIYNHSNFAVTRRYLGVTQDDKDAVYLGLHLTE